ncbi:MAG: PH domain-containing protein [Ferrimicrobium sp.]
MTELRIEMPAGTKHFAVADEIARYLPEEVFDGCGLKNAVEWLSKVSKLAGWREFRSVDHYLSSTETLRAIGQGPWQGNQSMVVLSDERLFFLTKGFVGATSEEFSLTAINSVVAKRRPIGEELIVTVAGSTTSISRMMHGQGDVIARGFRKVRTNMKSSLSAEASIESATSRAEELAKFASLH